MYAARIAEHAPVDELFSHPRHPYTWGLLGSLPRIGVDVDRLAQIPGSPPSLLHPPAGCRFHTRCEHVMSVCRTVVPELRPSPHDPSHVAACHLDAQPKAREAATLLATMTAEAV